MRVLQQFQLKWMTYASDQYGVTEAGFFPLMDNLYETMVCKMLDVK